MTKSTVTESSEKDPDHILVYPTNTLGTYFKGVAFIAVINYGARSKQMGQGSLSYALPTRDARNNPLEYRDLKKAVDNFLTYASKTHTVKFKLARLSPHSEDEVGPMFAKAPINIILPASYKKYVLEHKGREWWTG